MNERRRKLIPVSSIFMHDGMPHTNDVVHFKCTEGLPADALFIGLTYDHMRDVYYFCYQSAEWDEVPDGLFLPIFKLTFMNMYVATFLDQSERLIEPLYSADANKWIEEYRAFKKRTGWPE